MEMKTRISQAQFMLTLAFSLGLSAASAPTAAFGQATSNVQACVSITDDQSRLNCYDLAAGRKVKESSRTGKWGISVQNNPLDDTATTIAYIAATEGQSEFGKPVQMFARCKSDALEAYLSWGDYLGSDQISVTYRFDSEKAINAQWSLSTDSTATFVPNAEEFLRKVADSQQLVVQTTPFNSSPVTAIFDLTGSREAVSKVSKAATGCVVSPELSLTN